MHKRIELTNYRQHRALVVNFQNGVVALRGANEAGKSALLEAIGYALFGAFAFRKGDTLADVVTWGEKESSMKVLYDFAVNSVDYTIKRSKSGAEIKSGAKILATGQTEVRRYCETLLGASAEACSNLMLADQTALRGALSKGPSAAIELIEQLSNFGIIDMIIGLVQTKLPCGATTSVESRLTMLDEQMKVPVENDTGPLEETVIAAAECLAGAADAASRVKKLYDAVQEPARKAQTDVSTAETAERQLVIARNHRNNAQVALDSIKPVPGPSEQEIAAMRAAVTDAQAWHRAVSAQKALYALVEPENEWEGNLESLQSEARGANHLIIAGENIIRTADNEIIKLRAQKITQTACGLCGKDLRNVPEVVTKNAELDSLIAAQEAIKMPEQAAITEQRELHNAYTAILNNHMARQQVYMRCSEFITLDNGYVPSRWTWKGPDVTKAAPPNVAADLTAAEARVQAYQRDLGRKQQAEQALTVATENLHVAEAAVTKAAELLPQAQVVLKDAADRTQQLFQTTEALRSAQQTHQTALQALEQAQAVLRERQRAREALQAQYGQASKELDGMRFNNDLLKALRDARPAIVSELWDVVSASVSKYFSDIRGVPSVFSREDGNFKVDGHNATSLSGSALDALGLAIRISLTRTFLPNTRFLVLDEPAAAADTDRETNMLGVISTCDFDQVLLVTHSELCDSFATQVIHL